MNLVEDLVNVKRRINSIETHLSQDEEERKAVSFILSSLGQTDESLELELEGLKITEEWLTDTLAYYIEEKGFSIDKNYQNIFGEENEKKQNEKEKCSWKQSSGRFSRNGNGGDVSPRHPRRGGRGRR